MIERPTCQIGYPRDQIERIVGDRLSEFDEWMVGQTLAVCDGRAYDYRRKSYVSTKCGPHGSVVYGWDLARFLAGRGFAG